MGLAAASFAVRTPSPERVARELERACSRLRGPSGGVVFATGALDARLPEVAAALAQADLNVPLLLVPASGVLSDQGEIEQASAATGLVFTGATAEVVAVPGSLGGVPGPELGDAIRACAGGRVSSIGLFLRADHATPASFDSLAALLPTDDVFGAGTPGDTDLFAIPRNGEVTPGAAAAIVINGLGPPHLTASHAGDLITPFHRITSVDGPMVLRASDRPALEVLSSAQTRTTRGALLLAALSDDPTGADPTGPPLVLRPVRGVDPARGGVLISPDAIQGRFLAFAHLHPQASRERLERTARGLRRSVAGAAPRFGFYIDCAGRGAGLYGAPDVDVRILRSALRQVPFAGMQSAFELAPLSDRPALHLFTGVVALYTTPS